MFLDECLLFLLLFLHVLQVEADLAALMARQKILKDKHELEEQEERLKRKKEQIKCVAISEHSKWKACLSSLPKREIPFLMMNH